MPTLARLGPYRVFFYGNEGGEPPHVHIQRDRCLAKFWLDPVSLAASARFRAHELREVERLIIDNRDRFWRHGMSSSVVEMAPRAVDVAISPDELTVVLADGRRISAPLAWFPRLLHATEEQLSNWELLGDGEGIHWPEVDEDLSVRGLLLGTPSPESAPLASSASG